MKTTTRWRPDTCGCTIDQTWDDGTLVASTMVIACAAHFGVTNAPACVLEENQHKNRSLNALEDAGIIVQAWRIEGAERKLTVEVSVEQAAPAAAILASTGVHARVIGKPMGG